MVAADLLDLVGIAYVGETATGGFRAVTEADGFVRRIIDSTYSIPAHQMALQLFACLKNNL